MASETLHLTLHKKWFYKIAHGTKRWEFREVKPYWRARLEGRTYKTVRFKNGYGANAPVIELEFKGVTVRTVKQVQLYCIELGRFVTTPTRPTGFPFFAEDIIFNP